MYKTIINNKTETISSTEFKAKLFKVLDELDPSGIIITKRGRPVARLTPLPAADCSKLIGSMKGKITIKGDIYSTGRKWSAQR